MKWIDVKLIVYGSVIHNGPEWHFLWFWTWKLVLRLEIGVLVKCNPQYYWKGDRASNWHWSVDTILHLGNFGTYNGACVSNQRLENVLMWSFFVYTHYSNTHGILWVIFHTWDNVVFIFVRYKFPLVWLEYIKHYFRCNLFCQESCNTLNIM